MWIVLKLCLLVRIEYGLEPIANQHLNFECFLDEPQVRPFHFRIGLSYLSCFAQRAIIVQ